MKKHTVNIDDEFIYSSELDESLESLAYREANILWESITKNGSLTTDTVLSEVMNKFNLFNNGLLKAAFANRLVNLMAKWVKLEKDLELRAKRARRLIPVVNFLQREIEQLPQNVKVPKVNKDARNRKGVFISYSHRDSIYLSHVKRHFKPFLKGIDYWDDTRIRPGDKWKKEIEKAISETKVAILLISTDFFGSDFIETEELPPLLEAAEKDVAVILTLILKPCLFEEFPLLNQYQAMNPPSRPVSKMDENEREELFVNLVRQTKKVLDAKPEDDE